MSAGADRPSVWIGIDTGGTFTDLVLVDVAGGRYVQHKLPSTADDPARAILRGIAAVLDDAGIAPARVGFVGHGTTVATNAVLQGRLAPTGMLTTAGFRDVIEIARQRRPHFFNLEVPKPTPPAPRDARLEIAERIAEDGSEVVALDEAGVRSAVAALRAKQVQAIAICFLHSYADPTHEQRCREIVRDLWPEAYVSASHEVLAEFREYERFATTALNASLLPLMDRYLAGFEAGCHGLGIAPAPHVMQSNGGTVSADSARHLPVHTLFSGPAAGVIAAAGLGREAGLAELIGFDMGGTSTDVSLIRDGQAAKRNQREIAGLPVRARTLDIHTIGAGGGSIAWIDPGGLLKVGPESAGAEPGPAGYGLGGERPTVTDANLVLGRLNQRALLGGRMPVDVARARAAIAGIAAPLGLDLTEAAAGILAIVNANMMGALRVVSVEQGVDPRGHSLVAFGGAGPLHACEVAAEMGIGQVLVPPHPGLLSALGLLHADSGGDFSLTRLLPAEAAALPARNRALEDLAARGRAWMRLEGVDPAAVTMAWQADMRYRGQAYELILPLAAGQLDAASLDAAVGRFHDRHRQVNGYAVPEQAVEIVNLRLAVLAERPALPPERRDRPKARLENAVIERRPVWYAGSGFVETPVYDRGLLPAGAAFAGPAIVEQMDSTTVIPAAAEARLDGFDNLLIRVPSAVKRLEASEWAAALTL